MTLPKAKKVDNPYKGDVDIWQNIRLATRQGFDSGSDKQLQADDAHYQAEHQRVIRELIKEIDSERRISDSIWGFGVFIEDRTWKEIKVKYLTGEGNGS